MMRGQLFGALRLIWAFRLGLFLLRGLDIEGGRDQLSCILKVKRELGHETYFLLKSLNALGLI
jgi:hypothetical protein